MVVAAPLSPSDWQVSVDGCRLSGWRSLAQPAVVQHVYDGDTVRLADGRKVRLLGINTPEMGRDGERAQPFADVAKRQVEARIDREREWHLVSGSKRRDRYGRWLGYLLDREGVALGSTLVASGTAFWVAQGEDVSHVACFQKLESRARAQRRGVWGSSYWQPFSAIEVNRARQGFRLITGQVTRVEQANREAYVELDDRVVLRLSARLAEPPGGWTDLRGRKLEVRGWIVLRKLSEAQKRRGFKSYLMNLSSEYQLRLAP